MAILRTRNNYDQQRRSEKVILPNISAADIDMLVWWKGLALDPCNPKATEYSFRKFWNLSLKLRNSLFLCNGECQKVRAQLKLFAVFSYFFFRKNHDEEMNK